MYALLGLLAIAYFLGRAHQELRHFRGSRRRWSSLFRRSAPAAPVVTVSAVNDSD